MKKVSVTLEDEVDVSQICERLANFGQVEVSGRHTSSIPSMKSRSYDSAIDERISKIFIMIGIPPHIRGYRYLREAIKICTESPKYINGITKSLYPLVADRFETSSCKVERAIRHAIEVAWNRGRVDNLNNLFGVKIYNPYDKPTNGEFVALITDKLLIEGY